MIITELLRVVKIMSEKNVAYLLPTIKIPPVIKEEFIDAANNYQGTEYFQKFKLGNFILLDQPQITFNQGVRILKDCQIADPNSFSKIHKGGIYYWIGLASFLLRDYQTGVFFIDAAVSEDIHPRLKTRKRNTPAIKFLKVDGNYRYQAGRNLVKETQKEIENLLALYNYLIKSNPNITELNIKTLRKKFLRKAVSHKYAHWRSLATTFISFIIEWSDRNEYLNLRCESGTVEPFYIHLFKGCVLFESLIKANPKNQPPIKTKNGNFMTLNTVLQHVQQNLLLPQKLNISENEFQSVISNLPIANDTIETYIEFTGLVRNTIGHNIGGKIKFSPNDYKKLFNMIAISNIHVINCLY